MTTAIAAHSPLAELIAAHSPLAGQCPWDGTYCHDCSDSMGTWTAWPCPPLTTATDVTPIEGGWTITSRTAKDVR